MDRETLIRRISDRFESDHRVRAAWLSGSLARGTGDRHSDVDVWIVTSEADRKNIVADWTTISESITPTVLTQQVGELPVFCSITPEWLRFDVSVGVPDEVPHRARSTMKPLFDKDGLHARLRESGEPLAPDPARIAALVKEFFRVLGLLPVVVGREEHVLGVSGAELLRTMLIRLMLEDVAVEDRGGALRLSPLLPPDRLRALSTLPAVETTGRSVVAAHVACARVFLPLARELAARAGVEWPAALETACAAHLNRELGLTLA